MPNIQLNLLQDFVKCVDKMFPKPKFVNFVQTADSLTLYVNEDSRQVSLHLASQGPSYSCAIEAVKFLTAIKKLYGESIEFKFGKKLRLAHDNIDVSFPLAEAKSFWALDTESSFPLSESMRVAVAAASSIPADKYNFSGILIDSSTLAKFSNTALFLCELDFNLGRRLVITDLFSSLLGTKVAFDNIYFGAKQFGVYTNSICVASSYLHDSYPVGYMSHLNLSAGDKLSHVFLKQPLMYKFQRSSLSDVVNLVASIIGEEELSVQFTYLGREDDKAIWSINSKTYKGLNAEERIASSIIKHENECSSFSLHKKQILNTLKVYNTDSIFLGDNGKGLITISDENQKSVTLLCTMG
jgi:hypothetical protein